MIDVEQITVDVRMPSDEVRIVALQPYIRFPSIPEEPFQWSNDAVDEQLAAIHSTLDIARNGFGGSYANFTLFPEYSIPGLEGASAINDRLGAAEWPNESIVIAGIHGSTKDEYEELCDMLSAQFSHSNAPNNIPDNMWVNCCVIWIKNRDGELKKWIQPKIRPAWSEMNVTCNDMFCGSTVYIFECNYSPIGFPCRFVTLICFDWVASVAGTTVCYEFLTKLTELTKPNLTPLDWVFVVQHNPNPNHSSFLDSTYNFLTDGSTHPFVQRDNAIVVHANTAISQQPARAGEGGFSACVFSPSAQFDCNVCRPTVCMQPESLRNSTALARCKDVVFREMGECIHAFTVRVPRFVGTGATDRTYPLPLAHVYSTGDSSDPRLPGDSVPASVKWVNDSLDSVKPLSTNELAGGRLRNNAGAIEPNIIDGIRPSEGRAAYNSVNWAACSFSHGEVSRNEDRRRNADLWGVEEADALEHILHSLTSLGLAYSLDFENTFLHGAMQGGEGFIQVIAVRGETHQDCRLHYDEHIPHRGTDTVLVIARDRSNLIPTPEEYSRIYENLEEEGFAFLDYHTLISECRKSADCDTLKEFLDGILPRLSPII